MNNYNYLSIMNYPNKIDMNDRQLRDLFYTHYSIGKQIGKGGFGTIFSGLRRMDSKPVAIKVIKKNKITQWHTNECDGTRVPLEIALMLHVRHVKTCIQIYDYIEQETCFLIVMERLDTYKDLFDYITERGYLHETQTKEIFRQVVDTICEIYKLGVLHRDIKDENILVDMKSGKIKLIDFGAGTFAHNKQEKLNDFQGTRVYSPPEWISTQSYYGDRAQTWMLGVLLFNMLHGDIPWEEDQDILECRLYAHKSKLMLNRISKDAEDLMLKCLHIDDCERINLNDIHAHVWLSGHNHHHHTLKSHTTILSHQQASSNTTTTTTTNSLNIPGLIHLDHLDRHI